MTLPDVPKSFDLDYLVFQLSEGKPSEAEFIWNTWTFEQCFESVCMKQYEAYVQERILKANG